MCCQVLVAQVCGSDKTGLVAHIFGSFQISVAHGFVVLTSSSCTHFCDVDNFDCAQGWFVALVSFGCAQFVGLVKFRVCHAQ